MSLIFVDGCSHYTQAFLSDKWDVVNSLGTAVTQSVNTNGRFGGGAITFLDAGGSSFDVPLYIQRNYDGVGTIVIGMAVQQTATQKTQGGQWLEFVSGNTVQVGIAIMPSGQLRVFRSTNVGTGVILHPDDGQRTVLGTSVNAINSSSYDFLEVKIVHHTTTGSVEIKRNGAAFYSLTNVNTNIAGSGDSSSMTVGGYTAFSGGATGRVQLQANVTDVYMLNTTVDGADALNPVDFIGDRHWEPLPPTADGADTAWTITGSASHFANVDEVPPNTTDYNSTATLNAKDGFVVTTPTGPTTATCLLSATMYIQKNTGGSNEVKGFIRSTAPAYRNGTAFQVPTPWAFRQSFMCSIPGGGAITLANVAAFQLGYEKTI